jgi:hypothetical protein
MRDKTRQRRKAQENEKEETVTADISGSSEDATVREAHVWRDGLSEIAHKPND